MRMIKSVPMGLLKSLLWLSCLWWLSAQPRAGSTYPFPIALQLSKKGDGVASVVIVAARFCALCGFGMLASISHSLHHVNPFIKCMVSIMPSLVVEHGSEKLYNLSKIALLESERADTQTEVSLTMEFVPITSSTT